MPDNSDISFDRPSLQGNEVGYILDAINAVVPVHYLDMGCEVVAIKESDFGAVE